VQNYYKCPLCSYKIIQQYLSVVSCCLRSGAEEELTAAKQNAEQYQLAAQANEEALRDLNLVITLYM